MSVGYEEMMGSPMDVEDHPARDVPTATQHYAGEVVNIGEQMSNIRQSNEITRSISGSASRYPTPLKEPKVIPMTPRSTKPNN